MRINFCLEDEAEVKEYLSKDLLIYKLTKEMEASRAMNRTYEEDREKLFSLFREEIEDDRPYLYQFTTISLRRICEVLNIPVEQFKPTGSNDYDD